MTFFTEILSTLERKVGSEFTVFLMLEIITLVEATPISGPALICIPQLDSREIVEPTVLVMPTIKAPRVLQ